MFPVQNEEVKSNKPIQSNNKNEILKTGDVLSTELSQRNDSEYIAKENYQGGEKVKEQKRILMSNIEKNMKKKVDV